MDEIDEIVQEFLVESHENLDQLDRDLVALEREPGSRDLLGSIFRTIHTIKGTSGFLAFGNLESVTHVGENLLARLRDGKMSMTPQTTDVLLAMVDTVRELLAAIEAQGTEGSVDVTAVVQRISSILDGTTTPDPEPSAEPEPPAVAAEPGEEIVARRNVADSSIRVDVELLDTLMRLVGELVLTRNQIVRQAGEQEGLELVRSAQRLNLIATELQEGVMRTRMQPIDHLWSKLPRVVRDLGATCGKQVSLAMVGRETELDRSLLESVKDPLTHLVRNAVDHGLESPQDRVAAGKPAEGVLTLRAYHEGGQVVVEVCDDGAGIDPDRIAAKAIDKGLRTAAQLAQLAPTDVLQLIFLPGFSTAAAVTNVSGRGVGMDVVKTNIESIGGTIEVESVIGRGTTCRLRIPLTLAIVPALTVECAGDRYAIPQVSLLELVALDADRAATAVEDVNGASVYRLRGALLPLVRLADVLGVESDRSDGHVLIAVLQAEGKRFGLVIDRVLSTEEIVVKPLGARLKALGTYSGATILGDGRVALILDVQALARRALTAEALERGAASVAAETQRATGEHLRMLVAGIGGGRRVAIPLSSVARLESIAASSIELVGSREVVQYRGAILPLLRLDRHLGATSERDGDDLVVVVYSVGSRSVAIVVDEIIDIVDEEADVHSDVDDHGLLGSALIRDRIVEVLDVRAAILAADPKFYTAPEAEAGLHDQLQEAV
ncbi:MULTISPECIES: chemotaxis protein CheA [unclassified Nocardioides]|uniref:chemotaxis protein CheA n=1 Tax=unclassified Nocardioides TaxID=2615069 RepID=UPI0009F151FC|nr:MULTISPECIES: chemotaxis protein CheW [unclassified Nocardioides]GAW52099.1 ATPase domain-containing protein [Nocardioides sp. PD653-B2]GAW56762.1 ATPase domain-containing protein [Nocardioides sp. PD653]